MTYQGSPPKLPGNLSCLISWEPFHFPLSRTIHFEKQTGHQLTFPHPSSRDGAGSLRVSGGSLGRLHPPLSGGDEFHPTPYEPIHVEQDLTVLNHFLCTSLGVCWKCPVEGVTFSGLSSGASAWTGSKQGRLSYLPLPENRGLESWTLFQEWS